MSITSLHPKRRSLAVTLLVLGGLAAGAMVLKARNAPPETRVADVDSTDAQPPAKNPKPSSIGQAEALEADAETLEDPVAAALPEGFVGTATCAGCHPTQHSSYLETTHSRSLHRSDSVGDELTGQLAHPESLRSYEVVEKDGKLWHREWLHLLDTRQPGSGAVALSDKDPRMLVTELPVSHVMGSGSFAKGYLMADKQYLLQSPVTWYAKPNEFGMAPGYDRKVHSGMTRVITDECLFCHAGMISHIDDNDEQLSVLETAIGCERCHGPGLQHTRQYKDAVASPQATAGKDELTQIIHPRKLDRSLSEAICAQCHLQGDIVISQAGRNVWEFKPGERFDATRVSYKIDNAQNKEKTFVDHFDQLWQSECYLQSDSLTCISCHDPHHGAVTESPDAIQQANCLTCHDNESCGVALSERLMQNDNRCVACHMPKSASEVPHAATTNHRIAVYTSETASKDEREPSIRRLRSPLDDPVDEAARTTDLLAHAYWVLDHSEIDRIPGEVRDRALDGLLTLTPADADKENVLATIARLARHKAESLARSEQPSAAEVAKYWAIAGEHAQRTLELEPAPSANRKSSLEIMGAIQFDRGQFPDAIKTYTELTKIRRSSIDWYNLGLAHGRLQQFAAAEQAFREAIRLDATYAAPYRSLSVLYSSLDPALAERMRQTYQWLGMIRGR